MKCSKCNSNAIIELRYSREFLCRNCFIRLFEKRVRRTIRNNRLFGTDDKIAVAVSGGKDSVTVLKILNDLSKKINPKFREFRGFDFPLENRINREVIAITVDEGIKGYRNGTLKVAKSICRKLGVKHYIFSFKDEIGLTLDGIVKRVKKLKISTPPCSYCGVFRRDILNRKARELGVTKLATGHNLDDEIQASLMNFIRGDLKRIARMDAEVGIIKDEKFVQRIKPLRECPEKGIALYAILNNFGINFLQCPYSGYAFRETIRDFTNELENKHPGSKFQILRSTDELVPILRNAYETGERPKNCKICNELTSGKICRSCEMKKELGLI